MPDSDITRLLQAAGSGSPEANEELVRTLYAELRRLAGSFLAGERQGHTLQPTALVNEVYLRLLGAPRDWDSRAHFFGAAARAMRQILVDYARKRNAAKRRGGERVTLSDLNVESPENQLDLVLLDGALEALAGEDPRLVKVVELRVFAGCSFEEIGAALGYSAPTARRDWTYARAWLYDYLTPSP